MLYSSICHERKRGSQARRTPVGHHILTPDDTHHLKKQAEPTLKARKQYEETIAELIYLSIVFKSDHFLSPM
jgi:hypothetical protein